MGLFTNDQLLKHPYLTRMPRDDKEWSRFIQALNELTLDLTGDAIVESIQDTMGATLTDTASINLTYTDTSDTITAAVIPGGVNHNQLANLTVGDPHTQYPEIANTETITGEWTFRDSFSVEDLTATDSVDFTHNGTDFLAAFTTTANWQISGLTTGGRLQLNGAEGYSVGGASDVYSGWWGQATVAAGTGYVGCENLENGTYAELDSYGSTHATYPNGSRLAFSDAATLNGIWMVGNSARRYARLYRPVATKYFDIQDATHLRIFDDAETDSVEMYHDGTNFKYVYTNTTDVDISGATRFHLNTVLLVRSATTHILDGVTPSQQFCSTGLGASTVLALRSNTSNAGGKFAVARIPSNTMTDVTAVVDNDELGKFTFAGTDGTSLESGAHILALAKETWTATAHGTEIFIQTTTTGTDTLANRAMFSDTEIDLTTSFLDFNATTADVSCLLTAPLFSGSYAPGSFTIPTARYSLMSKRLQLTTTQRATLAGTARLRIS